LSVKIRIKFKICFYVVILCALLQQPIVATSVLLSTDAISRVYNVILCNKDTQLGLTTQVLNDYLTVLLKSKTAWHKASIQQ